MATTSAGRGLRAAGAFVGVLSILGGLVLGVIGLDAATSPSVASIMAGTTGAAETAGYIQIGLALTAVLWGIWIWALSNAIAQIADAFPPKS